jgi:hypothetical protein
MDLTHASAVELKALADARRRDNRGGPSTVSRLPLHSSLAAAETEVCTSTAHAQVLDQPRLSRSIVVNGGLGSGEPHWHTTEDEMVRTSAPRFSPQK